MPPKKQKRESSPSGSESGSEAHTPPKKAAKKAKPVDSESESDVGAASSSLKKTAGKAKVAPRKKQKKEATPSGSESESDGGSSRKKSSKAAKKATPKGNDGDESFLIEKTKFATVREFKGAIYVDIREHYEKDGDMLPGRKGISLTATQYQKLKGLIPEIDKALSKY